MLDRLGTNPTQVIGILLIGLATLACLSALRRRPSRDVLVWRALAFTNGLLVIEVLIGLRFKI
jgi:hypothetical protein